MGSDLWSRIQTLRDIVGRDKEFLITPKGKYVHGTAFFNTVLSEMHDANEILEFQVVQETKFDILINIVCKNTINMEELNALSESIKKRSEGWEVTFRNCRLNREDGSRKV